MTLHRWGRSQGGWAIKAAGGGSGPAAVPFQTIRADGFSLDASDPTAAVGQTYAVTRNGYDASANAITFSDTLSVTDRMRTVWNVGWTSAGTVPVDDATRCASSDYIYQGETCVGATNNSTVVSPTPVAAWVNIERQLIGNSITLEVVAGHRDARGAKPVACVTGTLTDGTNTVTAISATPVISSYAGDVQPLWVYELTFATDTPGNVLASDVLLTANAKVYPHVGVAASVADSSLSSDRRGFSPRYFIKNVSRLASPPIAYVSTGGTSGGVWSTTAATAEATPFDTLENARLQIAVQSGVTGGYVDGCEIRLMAGSHAAVLGTTATNSTCKVASLVITRDPNASRATAIMTLGGANSRARLSLGSLLPVSSGAMLFRDITITRTSSSFQGEAASQLEVRFDQCNIDNSSNTAWLSNSHDYHYGSTITTSLASSTWLSQNGATNMHRMWRGVTCLNARISNINMFYNFASLWYNTGALLSVVSGNQSGVMRVNNKYMNINYTSGGYEGFAAAIDASENFTGIYIAGNVYEPIPAVASYTGSGVSADEQQSGSTTHFISHNNTILGAAASFRCNELYDTSTTLRTHVLQSVKGNIMPQLNTKGDWFFAVNLGNPGGLATSHVGNWGYLYGVGCAGNHVMYIDAGGSGPGGSITQAYMGANSTMGTSATAKVDPLITTYAAVDYVAGVLTAGAGGSVFTLQGGSPCKNKLPYAVMPFDLAGTARSASGTDSTGAFV